MRELFGLLFDRITDPLGLPIEPWQEWLVLLVVNEIAYRISLRRVGDMFDSGLISSGLAGSFFHWLIRLLAFVVTWLVISAAIQIVKFMTAYWIPILVACGMLCCGTIGLIVYRRTKGGTQNA